jgi:hypothetical protein
MSLTGEISVPRYMIFIDVLQAKHMVEFQIKVNEKQHVAYIPREVIDALGLNLKLVGNRVSAVIYPEQASLADVVKSVKILLADLEHALEIHQKTASKHPEAPT